MKLIVKYFFLADLFLGVVLDLDKYIFPWQTCFLGGHLILEPSHIQVNTVIMDPLSVSYRKRCSVMHQLRNSKLNEKHL